MLISNRTHYLPNNEIKLPSKDMLKMCSTGVNRKFSMLPPKPSSGSVSGVDKQKFEESDSDSLKSVIEEEQSEPTSPKEPVSAKLKKKL